MEQEILQKIMKGKNILLVGKTDSGKSYFIKNQIIPLFRQKNINVCYFEECADLEINEQCDVYIIDEVEILFDKEFLESLHPDEKPYYTNNYLETVKVWQNKLSKITKPIICIVTRNNKEEIDYIYNNYKSLEWNNLPVEIVKFEKR
ncbi:MAG: hypothetical protein BWY53_00390 [Parcubacteria group bacterium ADurb.Bin326]|nr:MAG: hypothetical protein BWY53_00390 [Parcubacteria group bacterium ADurb.Bin326]